VPFAAIVARGVVRVVDDDDDDATAAAAVTLDVVVIIVLARRRCIARRRRAGQRAAGCGPREEARCYRTIGRLEPNGVRATAFHTKIVHRSVERGSDQVLKAGDG